MLPGRYPPRLLSDPTPTPLPAQCARLDPVTVAGRGIEFEGKGGGHATPFPSKKPPLPLAGARFCQIVRCQGEGLGWGARTKHGEGGVEAKLSEPLL